MRLRDSNFFCFVVQYTQYIEGLFDERAHINWLAVPGYIDLIKTFLCELKVRPLERYPDKLREASIRLVGNAELLNILIRILFRQTNVYVNLKVFRSIEMIESYFDYMKTRQTPLSSFDYKFFYSGIKIILESEHALVLARCLTFLYKHYSSFGLAFRREISLLLLGNMFFKLFLSWSKSVRQVFYSMLLYRINLDCNFTHKQKPPRYDEQQAN
jgi:hypothetical protein